MNNRAIKRLAGVFLFIGLMSFLAMIARMNEENRKAQHTACCTADICEKEGRHR